MAKNELDQTANHHWFLRSFPATLAGDASPARKGVTMVDDPAFPGANVGDVHTSAGYALLKFDVNQVGEILKTNLNDAGFRLQFLCKLAEKNPGAVDQ